MLSTLISTETIQFIDGPVGKLETAIAEDVDDKSRPWGIVCHPHPLYGGTMHNKVVTTLVKTFQGMDVNTIRFNFRGVGRSEGEFGRGIGELEDLFAVVNWLTENKGKQEIWLAGFSFGACIAAIAATKMEAAKKLVTVAPPVSSEEMQSLAPIHIPWVLAQGEQDEVIPALDVFEWAKSRVPKPIILRFPEATHFFHGMLGELQVRIEDALNETN